MLSAALHHTRESLIGDLKRLGTASPGPLCVRRIQVEVKLHRDGSMYDINNNTTKINGEHADSHGAHVCCVLAQGLGVLENRVK